jgi:hypothetical protein
MPLTRPNDPDADADLPDELRPIHIFTSLLLFYALVLSLLALNFMRSSYAQSNKMSFRLIASGVVLFLILFTIVFDEYFLIVAGLMVKDYELHHV